MNSRARAARSLLAFVGFSLGATAPGQVTPFTWSGAGGNTNWTTGANWLGDIAPHAGAGAPLVTFPFVAHTDIFIDAPQTVVGLTFDFTTATQDVSYSLAGSAGSPLTVGESGLTLLSPVPAASSGTVTDAVTSAANLPTGSVYFNSSVGIVLGANQTWSAGTNTVLVASSPVSGTGHLTLAGNGAIVLDGANTYTGGTTVAGARVGVASNSALGSGSVTVSAPSSFFTVDGNRNLANALNINTAVFDLYPTAGTMTFSGPVTLGTSLTLTSHASTVTVTGNISESSPGSRLTLDGGRTFVLSGANSYTGGTTVASGRLFLRSASAVPATGQLVVQSGGYLGVYFNTGYENGFLNRFDRANTTGIIGLETDAAASSPAIYNEDINLAGFSSAMRLGTTSRALVASGAKLLPASGGFRFGGGGGTLYLENKLEGAFPLTVESARGSELTVIASNGGNDYTGATTVTRSALVFSPDAMPPSVVVAGTLLNPFVLGTGGYIGSTIDQNFNALDFLGRFPATTVTGAIGFDGGTVTSPLNLSAFVGANANVTLATTSTATLSGTLTLPLLQAAYRFAGYKGGVLTVASTLQDDLLLGARSVRIGDERGDFPVLDPGDGTRVSTVQLTGSNRHSGGTYLHSGVLVVGHANALGTGALTIQRGSSQTTPRLETSLTTTPSFANAIVVGSDLNLTGSNGFTLAGSIADAAGNTGRIGKYGSYGVTVTGNNSGFTGGFLVDTGAVTFVGSSAAGTGALALGAGGTASFVPATGVGTSSPILAGLRGDAATGQVQLATGTTLTLQQATNTTYRGTLTGDGRLVKSGTGSLRLTNLNTYSGGTLLTGGTLAVGNAGALGTGSVTINGPQATLSVEQGVSFANAVNFGSAGGILAGKGTFANGIALNAGSGVAPGNSVGTLTFASGLTVAGGAFYNVEIQDLTGGPGTGWDLVQVNGTLTFTATPTNPFTLYLSSLTASGASGNIANFVATSPYSLQIVATTGGIIGFDPRAVVLDTTSFTNSLSLGAFNLTASDNSLTLNFTPVPEPSTWALMIGGFAALAVLTLQRRRRQR